MSNVKSSKPVFPENAGSNEYAASLDAADPLASFRDKFIIPSKANINSKKLAKPGISCPSNLVSTVSGLTGS